jgi:hydrogenase-4 component E
MNEPLNILIGLEMGLNLMALGGSQTATLVRVISLQGMALGLLTLIVEYGGIDWRLVAVALAMIVAKGFLIPSILRRTTRAANIVDREIRPTVGYVASLLFGAAGTVAAVVLTRSLPLLPEHAGTLLVPGALASILTGLILIIGRSKAVTQVCGYLIIENGIYLFGLLLVGSMPHILELGILFDVTIGVFVIGIIVDRIQRAFDTQDTRKLTTLQE